MVFNSNKIELIIKNCHLLELIGLDAHGTHQRVSQDFLSEVAAGHGLHGEQGDMLLGIHLPQGMAQVIELFLAGHNDKPLHLLCRSAEPHHVGQRYPARHRH